MRAAEYCTALTGATLTEVSKRVGKSPQTLRNWYRDNPELFKAVCIGATCVIIEFGVDTHADAARKLRTTN